MFVALIPARGGSKGIAKKNIAPLCGKPLLGYTAEAAAKSKKISRTFLSSDSQEIADTAKQFGVEVPFLRPSEVAKDDTPMIAVLQHFCDWLESQNIPAKGIVLLQPTSPLRTSLHIDEAVELFETHRTQSVVSVRELPHIFTPANLQSMGPDNLLVPFSKSAAEPTRRQDKPLLWARNGPAILIVSPALIRQGKLYGEQCYGYPMSARDSLDIDTPEDLELAEFYLRK